MVNGFTGKIHNHSFKKLFAHFETGGRKAATPLERSSVVEQLAYIQRVAGSIPSVPIADDDGSRSHQTETCRCVCAWQRCRAF